MRGIAHVLNIHLCLINIQMVVKIRGLVKRFSRGHFNFLGTRSIDDLLTKSMGGGEGPISISEGMLLYFDVTPRPRPPLNLSHSERG